MRQKDKIVPQYPPFFITYACGRRHNRWHQPIFPYLLAIGNVLMRFFFRRKSAFSSDKTAISSEEKIILSEQNGLSCRFEGLISPQFVLFPKITCYLNHPNQEILTPNTLFVQHFSRQGLIKNLLSILSSPNLFHLPNRRIFAAKCHIE